MKLDRSKLSYSAILAVASTSSLGMMGAAPALAADVTPVVVPPAPVRSAVSGYVELYGLFGRLSGDEGSDDYGGFGGAGRLNWWLSPNLALQLDAYGESRDSSSYTTFGIAGHLAMRDPRLYALGLMASTGTADSAPWSTLALEGQYYVNNLTLYGQVGATHSTSWGLGTYWYGFLQARYFVNPNFVLLADATFAKLSGSKLSSDPQLVKVGVQAEFRPASWPLSLFARLQHAHNTNIGSSSINETTVYAGIKLYAAQPSLLSNDRDGATFLDANPVYGPFNTKFLAFGAG